MVIIRTVGGIFLFRLITFSLLLILSCPHDTKILELKHSLVRVPSKIVFSIVELEPTTLGLKLCLLFYQDMKKSNYGFIEITWFSFSFPFSSSCFQKYLYTFTNSHIISEVTPLPPKGQIHVYKFLFSFSTNISTISTYQHYIRIHNCHTSMKHHNWIYLLSFQHLLSVPSSNPKQN